MLVSTCWHEIHVKSFKIFIDDSIFTNFIRSNHIRFFDLVLNSFRELPKDFKSSLDLYKSPHSWQCNGKCLSTMWFNNSSSLRFNFINSPYRIGSISKAHRQQSAFRPKCILFTWRSRHFAQQNTSLQNRQTLSAYQIKKGNFWKLIYYEVFSINTLSFHIFRRDRLLSWRSCVYCLMWSAVCQ